MSDTRMLIVAAYQPGALEIPAVEVTYFGKGGEVLTARTQPIAVTITSLIANEPEPKLKENAGPVPVIQRDYLYAYIAGGLIPLAPYFIFPVAARALSASVAFTLLALFVFGTWASLASPGAASAMGS